MRLWKFRPDLDGLGNQLYGAFVFALLIGEDAKKMQGNRVFGLSLKYPSINIFSLGQAVGGVVLDRDVQGLLDCYILLLFRRLPFGARGIRGGH